MTQKDELAELKARVAELERAKAAPAPYDPVEAERSTRKWMSEMHEMREGRANIVPNWLREACAGGVTDADARDLVRSSHAPIGPSSQGAIPSSQQVSNVRGVPGMGTGWSHSVPLGPSMHARYVDQQLDAQDAKDRAERIRQHAQLQAVQKPWTPSDD